MEKKTKATYGKVEIGSWPAEGSKILRRLRDPKIAAKYLSAKILKADLNRELALEFALQDIARASHGYVVHLDGPESRVWLDKNSGEIYLAEPWSTFAGESHHVWMVYGGSEFFLAGGRDTPERFIDLGELHPNFDPD